MSYEVFIDVRHYPRHLDHTEQRLTDAAKWAEPEGVDPSDADRMRTVCNALRAMADTYDPDVICGRCGEPRHAHFGYPKPLVQCYGQYGPITQSAWWAEQEQA